MQRVVHDDVDRARSVNRVLGIDIGTSSVKTILYDTQALPIPSKVAQREYAWTVARDGEATFPASLILSQVLGAVDDLLPPPTSPGELGETDGPSREEISGVGISCFWHSLVLADDAGEALTPVLLWADTRPALVMPELRRRVDPAKLRARTGCVPHASYWPAKLLWLAESHPKALKKATHILSIAELLWFQLFGRFEVSLSMASGTGLLNLRSGTWDEYALASIPGGCQEKLAAISETARTLESERFRSRWPCLANATWFPPLGDGACSNIGSGGVDATTFVVTLGTSSAVRATVPEPIDRSSPVHTSMHLWNYRLDESRAIVGGALSEGGNLVAWVRANMHLPSPDDVEAALEQRLPDADRLTVLPFIAGERSPDWLDSARAVIAGIGLETTSLDVLQGCLEAIAIRIGIVFQDLADMIGSPKRVMATGGALASSPAWTQILADVLNREVAWAGSHESSCRGAAAMALESMGLLQAATLDPLISRTFAPARHEAYRDAIGRHARLYREIMGPGRLS